MAFAKKHEIFILSDLAYSEVYFDDNPPPSVLEVPGAIDVTVEFTSMSKTFSMAGWRMGLRSATSASSQRSRGSSPISIMERSHPCKWRPPGPEGPDACIREMRETYRKRRDALVKSFGRAGWVIPPPQASMFAWAPLPDKFRDLGSMQFATLMVEKSGVMVSPGVAFGEHGEGYVRVGHGGKRAENPPCSPRRASLP